MSTSSPPTPPQRDVLDAMLVCGSTFRLRVWPSGTVAATRCSQPGARRPPPAASRPTLTPLPPALLPSLGERDREACEHEHPLHGPLAAPTLVACVVSLASIRSSAGSAASPHAESCATPAGTRPSCGSPGTMVDSTGFATGGTPRQTCPTTRALRGERAGRSPASALFVITGCSTIVTCRSTYPCISV